MLPVLVVLLPRGFLTILFVALLIEPFSILLPGFTISKLTVIALTLRLGIGSIIKSGGFKRDYFLALLLLALACLSAYFQDAHLVSSISILSEQVIKLLPRVILAYLILNYFNERNLQIELSFFTEIYCFIIISFYIVFRLNASVWSGLALSSREFIEGQDPNELAFLLSLFMSMTCYRRSLKTIIIWILTLLLVLHTGSRMGQICFVLVTARIMLQNSRVYLIFPSLIILSILLVSGYEMTDATKYINRWDFSSLEAFSGNRVGLWINTFNFGTENWLLGHGISEQKIVQNNWYIIGRQKVSHNTWLDLFVYFGLPGLLYILLFIKKLYRMNRGLADRNSLIVLFVACMSLSLFYRELLWIVVPILYKKMKFNATSVNYT